jgi:hypothetical protein
MHIGLHHHRQQGPVDAAARLQQRREERALAQLGDPQFHVTGLGRQQPGSSSVAVGGAGVSRLVAVGADVLGGLGVDQRLQHQPECLTDDIQATTDAQRRQQVGHGRLVKGHRGELLVCTLAGTH